ncbi:MAG: adenylate/guanylate cyclase domain-containing protein [Candidatus Eremiobacterota bacterium]
MRLRTELMLLTGLLVAATLGLLLLVGSSAMSDALRGEIRNHLRAHHESFRAIETLTLDLLASNAHQLALDPVLQEMRLRDPATLRNQATGYFEDLGLDVLVLTDPQGKPSVYLVRDGGPDAPETLTGVSMVRRVLEEGMADPAVMRFERNLYLMAAAPLERGGYVDGALLAGRRIRSETAREASRGEAGMITVFAIASESAGLRVVADYDTERKGKADPELLRAVAGRPVAPGVAEARLAGAGYLVSAHPLVDPNPPGGRSGWVIYLKRLEETERHVQEMLGILLAGGATALLMGLSVAYYLAYRTSRPIESLARDMRRVGEGDLDLAVSCSGSREVVQLGESFNQMMTGLRHKRVLEKYVPREARTQIEQDEAGQLRFVGRRVTCAILFSDLRGFTAMSERLEPADVMELLNQYLAGQARVIEQHHGDINEYIGDAILAVFKGRAPALLAVSAALEMRSCLARLRESSTNPEVGSLRQGIGIHLGTVVEGTIGTSERVKHAVVGDTVNLAARIQDRSRDGKHTQILVSQQVYAEVLGEFDCAYFGEEQFKGKSRPVAVWELIGRRPDRQPVVEVLGTWWTDTPA